MNRKKLSVIVPMYYEEEVAYEFYNRLKNVVSLSLRHLYNPFHVVFILPSTIAAKP